MKRWISGGVTFLLICVITIITEWYNSNKKEEVYECISQAIMIL